MTTRQRAEANVGAMHRQRGLTLIGVIIVLAVAGFFGYLIMRVFPVYSEYYGVVSAMKALQAEPGVANMPPERIRDLLDRKFYIGYVKNVQPNNVKIRRQGGNYLLTVSYEVRDKLIYNLDYIATFNKTVNLTRKGEID